jgi:transposase InsO family protein
MNSHKNARVTLEGRKLLIRRIDAGGLTPAAEAAGVSLRTAKKWQVRFRHEGCAGQADRTSRPQHTRSRVDAAMAQRIEQLRRTRMPMRSIAARAGVSVATVSRFLARIGLSRLKALEPPAAPPIRYEHQAPGDLLHLDTKKLDRFHCPGRRVAGGRRNRGAGCELAHVAIDDHSRAGFVQIRPNEREDTTVAFLLAAIAHYASLGVRIRRILTDNGPSYRSHLFARTCQMLGIEHRFTRPYRPQTNGKAERFIQTCLREWAYGRAWQSSEERNSWLPAFMDYYNSRRPHSALAYKPPDSRIGGNNLLQLNT